MGVSVVYDPHIPSSEKAQRGAKCSRKHKNNNKMPVYFDNIILDGHKSRHVTSNRFRFPPPFEEGFKQVSQIIYLKVFCPRRGSWLTMLPFDSDRNGDERFLADYN